MAGGLDGELELGADPIGARYQHWPAIAIERQFDHGAKAADARQHFRAHGACHEWLDALDQCIPRIDIDTGITVGVAVRLAHEDWPGNTCRRVRSGLLSTL